MTEHADTRNSAQKLLELEEIKKTLEEKVNERTQQLEQAKKEWERTFDAIDDPVVILSDDYKVLRANLALSRIVKQDIRNIINHNCYELLMERDTPCENCPIHTTVAEQKGLEAEIHQIEQGKTYHLRSFPMSQEPPRIVHEYRDITEKKAIQKQMMITDKLSSLGLLAGGVAHEINNPIAGILAQTQLLLMDSHEDNPFLEQALKEIEKAAHRCRKIVQDLLNFSRQKPTVQKEKQQLNQIIHHTLELYTLLPHKERTDVESNLDEDLPTSRLDADKLQSVILNLLINARDASPSGGTIKLSTRQQGDNIILEVSDHGSGIPPELQEKIFTPFFTTKEKGLGTGLGLYISQEIIQEHEGSITLTSAPNEGTTFTIELPIR